MTSNEQLVRLYRSTSDKKLKDKTYQEIFDKNIGLVKNMINKKCKMNVSDIIKDIHVQDLYQEAKIALHIALQTYNEIHNGESRMFSTYFTWLINGRMNIYMRDQVYPQICNDIHIDLTEAENNYINGALAPNKHYMIRAEDGSIENAVDNNFIRDNILLCIDKINFREEWHKRMFQYKFGVNEGNIYLKEREMADMFNVTQQRIGFLCKDYKDKLRIIILEQLNNGYKLEDFGLTEV